MARRDRLIRGLLRQKFMVTTKAGHTWDGLLTEVDESTLQLHEAAIVNQDGTRTPADGQVFIPRCDVAYMQRT